MYPVKIEFYQHVNGQFGEKLRNSIVTDAESSSFLLKDGRCPFLNAESLCDIFIHIGEENMCTTCKTYPRKNWTYGDLTFIGKCISCPEVARILFESQSPLQFSFTEDFSVPNQEIDWALFNSFITGMTTSIGILQNHELSFQERMRALLLFNYYFQEHLDSGKDCTELFGLFSSDTSIHELIGDLSNHPTNYGSRMSLLLTIAKNLSLIVDNAPILDYLSFGVELLKNPNQKDFKELLTFSPQTDNDKELSLSHIHEQYAVYYIAMYYMNFMTGKQPYQFVVQFFTLFYLQSCFEAFVSQKESRALTLSEIIDIYTRTARVYEHSYKNQNLNTTFSVLEKNELSSLSFLLSLI